MKIPKRIESEYVPAFIAGYREMALKLILRDASEMLEGGDITNALHRIVAHCNNSINIEEQ